MGAVFVLLGRTAADAAGADELAVPEDRHRTLAIEHVIAFRVRDAAQGRMIGAFRQVAARSAKGRGCHRLTLTAETAGPHGAVHPLEGNQTPAVVANGDVHLRADLFCWQSRLR